MSTDKKSIYLTIQERLLSTRSGFGTFVKAGRSVDFHHDDGSVYRVTLKPVKTSSTRAAPLTINDIG